ncbi:MAG: MFS transporter [Pseudomonadota bacterium]
MLEKRTESDGPARRMAPLLGPCLSIVLASLGISIAAVTLPDLSRDFVGTGVDTNLVITIYILATTALLVPAGRAGDLFGKRTVLVGGLTVYGLGSVLALFSESLSMLIAARFIMGAGAAAMMAMPLAQVRDVVAPAHTGRWMGVMGTMSAIGTASGPALGGAITASLGWRGVFLVQIPLAVIAIGLCLLFLSNGHKAVTRPRFDLAGAIAMAVSLAALTFLISDLAAGFGGTDVLWLPLAVAAFAAFLIIEARAEAPIVALSAFRSRPLSLGLGMNAIISLVMMGVLVTGPFFLTGGLGLTTAQMGLAMSVGPISAALSGVPAGRLVEWVGPGRAVVVGSIMVSAGAAGLAGLPYVLGLVGFVLAFVILAPGYQLFLAAVNTLVMATANDQDRGVISGLLNLGRSFGFIVGASVMSTLFWWLVRINGDAAPVGQDIRFAMVGTFAFAAALTAGVAGLALALPAPRSTDQRQNETIGGGESAR